MAMNKEYDTITDSTFTAGKDDTVSLSAGVIGEIGYAEVREDSNLSGYEAITVGRPAISEKELESSIYAVLKDDADAACADTVKFRIVATNKQRSSITPLTQWFSQREADDSSVENRPKCFPKRGPSGVLRVTKGKLIVLQVKDDSASVDVELANSTIEIPMIGYY